MSGSIGHGFGWLVPLPPCRRRCVGVGKQHSLVLLKDDRRVHNTKGIVLVTRRHSKTARSL